MAVPSTAPGSVGGSTPLWSHLGRRLRPGVDTPINLDDSDDNVALEKLLPTPAGGEASRGDKRSSMDHVDGAGVKRERRQLQFSTGGQLGYRDSGFEPTGTPTAGTACGSEEGVLPLCQEEMDALAQIPKQSMIAFDFDGVFHRSVQEVAPGKYYAVRTQHPKSHQPFTDMLRRAEWYLMNEYQLKVVTANNPKVVAEFFQNPTLKQFYPRLYSALNGGRSNVLRGSSSDGKFSDLKRITARIFYDDSMTTLEPLVRNIHKAGATSPLQAVFRVFPVERPSSGKPQPAVALHYKR